MVEREGSFPLHDFAICPNTNGSWGQDMGKTNWVLVKTAASLIYPEHKESGRGVDIGGVQESLHLIR
jgi:hypothetical protein